MTRLEAIAGSENPYSLLQILGKGHLVSRAGATVYVTKCKAVSVEPRSHTNCTHEIPAFFNGTEVFVDPFSLVIKQVGTISHCNAIAPPRFQISGKWYCGTPSLQECHAPEEMPLSPLKISDWDEGKMGLGRAIYSPDQIHQFNIFQQVQHARNAFISEQTGIAFQGKNEKGEWGLSLSSHAKEMMLDAVGFNFIPLYRFVGPISVTFILILFIVGLVRIFATVIFRIIVLIKIRGVGIWLLGAVWNTVYQLLITPVRWADNAARDVAERVGNQMTTDAAAAEEKTGPWKTALELLRKSAAEEPHGGNANAV